VEYLRTIYRTVKTIQVIIELQLLDKDKDANPEVILLDNHLLRQMTDGSFRFIFNYIPNSFSSF
jgi:hypothetical protein